jgi:ABC-type phosphate transport system substrate-binding protein
MLFGLIIMTTLAVFGSPRSAATASTDLVFIASDQAPVHTLTADDILNIYLGKKRIAEGSPVYAVDQSETQPIKLDFLRHVMNMTHAQYREQLLKRRFQEGAVTPKFVSNSAETLKTVRETPGAIGYVYQSEIGTMLGLRILATFPTR